MLNAGYTQTHINRQEHDVIGHQANANLGIPGVAETGYTAGHNQEYSWTEQGYNVGSQAHLGIKSTALNGISKEAQVNANVHYGHSTLASGVPVGVKLGASVGADKSVNIADKVQVKT